MDSWATINDDAQSVVALIRKRVLSSPDTTALVYTPRPSATSTCLSYSDIWTQACAIAASLSQHSRRRAGPGTFLECVGVMITSGPMLPVLELAILVANMVIVPLDPQQPQSRLGLLVQDSEPWIVVTDGEHAIREQTLVSALSPVVVSVQALLKTPKGGARPLPDPIASSVSHVFFTSGSTGRPKGCISTHGALAAYCVDKNKDMGVSQTSRVFAASSLSFDPSLGTFSALGLCLQASEATHLMTTPSIFGTLEPSFGPEQLPSLQVVALGGEPMTPKTADTWAPRVTLYNIYGVTECCVYQALGRVRGAATARSIERGIGRSSLFLIDRETRGDITEGIVGVVGELCLCGPQVGMEGYLGRPELTNQSFWKHETHGPCYRTGDLARTILGGGFEMRGRKDDQIKLRGVRIELGEVERVLLAQAPALASALCVVLVGDRLVAYYVPTTEATSNGPLVESVATAVEVSPHTALMSRALSAVAVQHLPPVMVPSRFILLPAMPRTDTGKVARRKLAKQPIPIVEDEGDGESSDDEDVARTLKMDVGGEQGEKNEEDLARVKVDNSPGGWRDLVTEVWSAELGFALPRRAHFQRLGGESLGALRICRRLQERVQEEHLSDLSITITTTTTTTTTTDLATEAVFGELWGPLRPLELLSRPLLSDFARHLWTSFGPRGKNGIGGGVSAPPPPTPRDPLVTLALEACARGCMPVLRCLLAGKSVDVQAPMGVGGLTLLHVACSNGQLAVAKILLEHKASARASDHKGVTPLHLAALHATKPLVALLLTAKAVVGARDASQQTVLHYAARGGAAGVLLDVLLEAYTKDSGVLKGGKAKSASLVDPRDAWQRTPLHWAVINGHQAVVVRLLGAGADAKARDLKENSVEMAERRAKCGASDRQDGARASVWGSIATVLGGSGKTKDIKAKAKSKN